VAGTIVGPFPGCASRDGGAALFKPMSLRSFQRATLAAAPVAQKRRRAFYRAAAAFTDGPGAAAGENAQLSRSSLFVISSAIFVYNRSFMTVRSL
jgi:hypothetical protein